MYYTKQRAQHLVVLRLPYFISAALPWNVLHPKPLLVITQMQTCKLRITDSFFFMFMEPRIAYLY